jgi:hypothetical protein
MCVIHGGEWSASRPDRFTPRYRLNYVGRDTSVGIASRYGLDGPGIESRWRREFPHPSRPALRAHSLSYKMGTGSLSRG